MKKYLRVLTTAAAALVLVLIMSGSVFAGTGTFTMSETAKPETVTVNWSFTPDSGNIVLGYVITNGNGKEWSIDASKKTATITGLKKGHVDRYTLYAVVQYVTEGYVGKPYSEYIASTYVNTTPKKLSKSKYGIMINGDKYVEFGLSDRGYMSGAQVKLYTVKPSKLKKKVKFDYSYSDKVSVKNNVAYKYKMRYYYKNPDNGKTYYGDWSSYKYFIKLKSSYTTSSGKAGGTIKLKGIKGVKKYVVYVSTSRDKLGKKTKTVKNPSIGKTKKVKITKIGKKKMSKKKTYYITVKTYLKSGKKNGTASEIAATAIF